MQKHQTPYYIFSTLLALSIVGLAFVKPIAQDPSYHQFADNRSIWGIPFFWDVVSNLPMFFIGAYGIWHTLRHWFQRPAGVVRWIPFLLYLGIFFTSFGSAYYHWMPDNHTLVWDRLPMTLMFMALFSLLLYDYLGKKAGEIGFWLAIPLGVLSVLYWHFTEAAGYGDLRPYAFVQFFPMIAAPALILLFPGKTPYVRGVVMLLIWYILAKICEHQDANIYQITGFWSGHTIKHLLGAIGLLYIGRIVETSPGLKR